MRVQTILALTAILIISELSGRAQDATNCYSGGVGADYALDTMVSDVHLGGSLVTISSAANRSLTMGSAPVPISPIMIAEDPSTPGITSNAVIAVWIPDEFLMAWDETNCAPTFVGTAAGKVNPFVSYTNSNRRLLIVVTENFSTDDTLTVSGLAFKDYLAAGSTRLKLDYDNDGLADATDDKTITIIGV